MVYFQSTSSACARRDGLVLGRRFVASTAEQKSWRTEQGRATGGLGRGRGSRSRHKSRSRSSSSGGKAAGSGGQPLLGRCLASGGRVLRPAAHLGLRLGEGWEKRPCLHALLPSIGRKRLALTLIPPPRCVLGPAWDVQPQLRGACRYYCAVTALRGISKPPVL